jgi:chromosome transmission fidelity protein 1
MEALTSLQDLISSLLALSTVTLPLGTLNVCLEQLTAYISRFKNRLASKHVLHLKRLYRLLHTLKGLLSNWQGQNSNEVMTVDGLLSKLGGKLEEINFLEIQNYLRKSKAWRNPLIRPSRKHSPMTIASKENHDVHAEGESKV